MDKAIKSGVTLTPGETVIVELEAELWASSPNPIAKFFGGITRVIARIFGHRKKGFLVITNKRVLEVTSIINCYVFNTDKEVKYVLPSSIKEVGFTRASTCGCFCPVYNLYYDAHTQRTSIQLQTAKEEDVQKIVDAFYNTIAGSQRVDF